MAQRDIDIKLKDNKKSGVIFSVCILLVIFLLSIANWIGEKVFSSKDIVFFSSKVYFKWDRLMSGTLLIIFCILFYFLVRYRKRGKEGKIGSVLFGSLNKKIIIILITIVLIAWNIVLFFSYNIFYQDEAFSRSIINLKGKRYSYSEIAKVKTYYKSNTLYYKLIMKDKSTINLTDNQKNIKFIPIIENKVPKDIPHIIDSDGYDFLKWKKIFTQEQLNEIFTEKSK